jgi:hypothetical protein
MSAAWLRVLAITLSSTSYSKFSSLVMLSFPVWITTFLF